MALPKELAQVIRDLGQRFDPEVAKVTREYTIPLHDLERIEQLDVKRDVSYGSDERHRFDIYGADSGDSLKPVVVFVHGGAFVMGDKSASDGAPFYENIGAWAVDQGIACVAMTYRLAPANTYPAGAEDIAAVIEWIHSEGHKFGLDHERIFLMGQSAGAVHVATYLAKPELQLVSGGGVAAAILLSGLYDMKIADDNPPKFAYFGKDNELYSERSSLQGLVNNFHAPLLLGVCQFDPADFQQQALLLANALFARDEKLPSITYQIGHNHLSSTYLLGSQADDLGTVIGEFVEQVLN